MTEEEIKVLKEKAARADMLELTQKAMSTISTEDELLEAAGVHPGAVQMNDGLLTAAQEAAIARTHSPVVAKMLIQNMQQRVADAQKQKKDIAEARKALLQSFFPDRNTDELETITKNVNAWAEEKLDKEELAEMRKLIDAGGAAQKLAMKELVRRYKSENSIDQPMTGGIESGAGTFNKDYISMVDWFNEREKLKQAGKTATSREMKLLDDRRLRSQKQERKHK